MSRGWIAALPVSVCLALPAPAAAQVEMAIGDGRVSLRAADAALRDVLAEWERAGRTTIVNRDEVADERLTLRLEDVSEAQALAILLRSVNGYVAAPRAVPLAGASRFDRIMILPGRPLPGSAAAEPPAPAQPEPERDDPSTQAPFLPRAPEDTGETDEIEQADDDRPMRVVPVPAGRRSAFGTVPRRQQEPEDAPDDAEPLSPTYGTRPSGPAGGVPVPGMLVPAPRESEPSPDDRPGT